MLNFEDVRFREPYFSFFYLATQVSRTVIIFLGWAPSVFHLMHAIANYESWWRWVNFAVYGTMYGYSLYSVLRYNEKMNKWYDKRLIQVSRGYIEWSEDPSGWVDEHMDEIIEERDSDWSPDSDDEDPLTVFPGVRYDPDKRVPPKREPADPVDPVDPVTDEVVTQGDDGGRQIRSEANDLL